MVTIKKDILNCKILIIEDDLLGRMILKEIFTKQGFSNIEEAENGKEGLEKTRTLQPDLIILDVVMPTMDGIECCKKIRADPNPKISNIPILFQTALDGLNHKTKLFEMGATDYLTKPIDPHEITARTVIHLEREAMNKKLREFNARMEQELEIARMTQSVLIPDNIAIQEMEQAYDLQICGHYQTSSELGGDFWGFKSISNKELAVYMVDFSGHGVNAALNVFRLHALMQSAMDTAHTPSAYLAHLNAILSKLLPIGQFATMFYGIINRKNNKLLYASAASQTAILFNKQMGTSFCLESTGTLLGAFKESSYQMHEIQFNAGDCLLLYSDALLETPNASGKMQTIEELMEKFQDNLKIEQKNCKHSFAKLTSDFNNEYGKNLNDDLTLAAYFCN